MNVESIGSELARTIRCSYELACSCATSLTALFQKRSKRRYDWHIPVGNKGFNRLPQLQEACKSLFSTGI
jgi:hypothetical protein